jgi:protein involved in polysaccharide export with SLBB domain
MHFTHADRSVETAQLLRSHPMLQPSVLERGSSQAGHAVWSLLPRLILKILASMSFLIGLSPAMAQMSGGAAAQNPAVQEILRGILQNQGAGGFLGGLGNKPKPAEADAQGRPLDKETVERLMGRSKRKECRFAPVDGQGRPLLPELRSSDGRLLGKSDLEGALAQRRLLGEELYVPSGYELYVKAMTGHELCRYGYHLVNDPSAVFEPPPLSSIPDDYVLGAGDELFIRVWGGSSEQDLSAVIDRAGIVFLPKVGSVKVGGVRLGDAASVLRKALRKSFSEFNVSVTLGELRGIRIYLAGHALKPGAYTVSNLSSLSSVLLAAGGPGPAGSYRRVELRRQGAVVATFDLYDLLLRGDKSQDRLLTNEDVIFVAPIGDQVAVLGGVNEPGVFEIKPGEAVADLITMSGGLLPGVGMSALRVLPIAERARGFQAAPSPTARSLVNGDIFVLKDDTQAALPSDQRARAVYVEGQVRQPGQYFLPPGSTLEDAVAAAGGLTPGAYVYGLRLTRESVRAQQEVTLLRVLRELDRDLVAGATMTPSNSEEARLLQSRAELSRALVERLQAFQPDGRVTLPIEPTSGRLPLAAIENGDRITVPSIPNEVGVFGSVVNAGSFLFAPGATVGDYLGLAGGARKGADVPEAFVIRANGEATRFAESGAWISFSSPLKAPIYPGDTVVVPENMNKTTVYRELASYATLLYQLGLGVAALKVLRD